MYLPIRSDIVLLFEQMKSVGFPQLILIKYLKEDCCFGVEDSPIVPSFLIVDDPLPIQSLDWYSPPVGDTWMRRTCAWCLESASGHVEDPPTYVNEETSRVLQEVYGLAVRVGLICRRQIKNILFRIHDQLDSKLVLEEGSMKAFLPLPELVGKITSFMEEPRGVVQLALTSKFHYNLIMNREVWSQYCSSRFPHLLVRPDSPRPLSSTNIIPCNCKYAAWRYWKHTQFQQQQQQQTDSLSDDALWKYLQNKLPQDEPRIALLRLMNYRLPWKREEEDRSGMASFIFILWVPELATMRMKMIFSATKGTVKDMLKGISREYGATDLAELPC